MLLDNVCVWSSTVYVRQGVELGVGDRILFDALKKGLGCSQQMLATKMGDDGDLGLAAQKCKAAQRTLNFGAKPKPLSCRGKVNECVCVLGGGGSS